MASSPRLKRKQLSGHGAVMGSAAGSYGPPGGVFGLYPSEPLPRDRRKRRKDKLTWVEHTFTPHFDGHLWRKYGQKIIKDSPFPRLYFRCSYREDKKCMASKQVQQENSDDPPRFMVTYEHEHSCGTEPIPTPNIDIFVAEAEPASARDGLVLRFGSTGDIHHRDARLQQERQRNHHPGPPSPFMTMNFNSWTGQQHDQQASALPSEITAPGAASWSSSSSFPIIEASPTMPLAYDEGGMFLTWEWDSFRCCVEDHFQFGDQPQFPGNSSGSLFSWEIDGCSLAHTLTGIEAAGEVI
ncbi:hypothetical protein ACP70R_011555 [Stipagrostis hirtigluma subsp. patula]